MVEKKMRVEPLMVGLDRACEYLGISRAMGYKLVAAGDLRHVRVGKSIRVPISEIHRFIADGLTTGEPVADADATAPLTAAVTGEPVVLEVSA